MSVRVSRDAGVLTVLLDRPEKRNAVSIAMWATLETTLRNLDPEDEVLVVRGAGGAFSSGSDVREFSDPACDVRAGIETTHRAIESLAALAIPSIAVVDGIAAARR